MTPAQAKQLADTLATANRTEMRVVAVGLILKDLGKALAAVNTKTAGVAEAVAKLDALDVDEGAVAGTILETLTPEAIAAALPAEVAEAVAAALAARLQE